MLRTFEDFEPEIIAAEKALDLVIKHQMDLTEALSNVRKESVDSHFGHFIFGTAYLYLKDLVKTYREENV